MGELFDLVRVQPVAVKIQPVFRTAIRIEINHVSVPHRKRIGPFRVRHLLNVVGLEIVNPDVLGHASRVAFPCAKVPEDAVVGDAVSIR